MNTRTKQALSCGLLAAALLGCHTRLGSVEERDQQLISLVFLNDIRSLPDSFVFADFAPFRPPSEDSARAMFRANWASWWHNAQESGVRLPPEVRARFAHHFDLAAPPPDPYPGLDSRYRVRFFRIFDDSSAIADVGPSFSGCTYTFTRRGRRWYLLDSNGRHCWLS